MTAMAEYEKAQRLYARIQATPWHQRSKKFGKRWPVVANDVTYFAEVAGVSEEEACARMGRAERNISVDCLVVVCA